MERKFREMADDTKFRISQKMRGRSMSDTHREAISNSMKAYWATIPNKPKQNNTSINKFENEKNMQQKNND